MAKKKAVSKDPPMQIKMVGIGDLKPYDNNPKQHTKEQIDKIASSIKTYGFRVPILIGKDGEVIAGHGRIQASEQLGLKSIPSVLIDDLSDEQVRAFRIADNKVAEADWLIDVLGEELSNLAEVDDLYFGFDSDDIKDILGASGHTTCIDSLVARAEGGGEGGQLPENRSKITGINFMCTKEQRDVITEAISVAKKVFKISNQQGVLPAICSGFLEGHDGETAST